MVGLTEHMNFLFRMMGVVVVLPKFQLGLQFESLNFDLVGLQKCSGQLNCFSTNIDIDILVCRQ